MDTTKTRKRKRKRKRPTPNVFTTFGKAIKSSIGLSFSRSGEQNCHRGCRLFGTCYAEKIERIYLSLNRKLAKHYKYGPTWVVNKAIAQWKPVIWGRISVDGSLPARSTFDTAREWRAFVTRLRVLVQLGIDTGAHWHIPVEDPGKARTYRAALKGLGVVVRRTAQTTRFSDLLKFRDHYAWVVAKSRITRGRLSEEEKQENVEEAYRVAAELRAHGQTGVVCAAVARSAKCGACKACSDPNVQFVLYPFHN